MWLCRISAISLSYAAYILPPASAQASPRTETPADTTDQSLSITSLVPSPVKPGADEALESGKCEACDLLARQGFRAQVRGAYQD